MTMTWDELTPSTEVTILGVNFSVLYGSASGGTFLQIDPDVRISKHSVAYQGTIFPIPENQQVLHHVESHVRVALRTLQFGIFTWYRDWRVVSKSIDQMLTIQTNIHDGKYVGGVKWSYRHDTANIRVEYVADVVGTEVLLVTGPMMEDWSAETPLGNRELNSVSFEEAAAEALTFYHSLAKMLVRKLQRE